MRNIQIERQAVSPRAILDFTLPRIPTIPDVVLKRFPDVKQTVDELDRFRIAMQLQLREQFVALREQVPPTKTIETLETFREETTIQLQKIETKLQTIIQIFNPFNPTGKATPDDSGLVKVDKTVADPLVYLATTVDDLLAQLKLSIGSSDATIVSQINQLDSAITVLNIYVNDILANAAPLIHFSGYPDPNTAGIVPNPITSTLATQWCVNDDTDEKWFWNPVKMFWYS